MLFSSESYIKHQQSLGNYASLNTHSPNNDDPRYKDIHKLRLHASQNDKVDRVLYALAPLYPFRCNSDAMSSRYGLPRRCLIPPGMNLRVTFTKNLVPLCQLMEYSAWYGSDFSANKPLGGTKWEFLTGDDKYRLESVEEIWTDF